MSLKAFHVLFILASIGLAAWFGTWAVLSDLEQANGLRRTLGVLSLLAAAGLVLYLVGFLRKLRGMRP